MKIALTGGHLSPALALIDTLKKEDTVIFFGRKYAMEGDSTLSLEYQVIVKRDIPFVSIKTSRLQRAFTRHTLPSMMKFPMGFSQALRALRKEKPDIVVAFGGYVSLPVCMAAKILRIPIVIHEQTMEAGVANKIVAKFASKVCISWESSKSFFPVDKTVLTGNPMKKFITSKTTLPFEKEDSALPLIYITGGSTGSHGINVIIEQALEELLHHFRVLHQTGDAKEFGDFDRLKSKKKLLSPSQERRYTVEKFLEPQSIGTILENAAVVISRSGVNTVTELMAIGTPALFIPLQTGQRNEQLQNALFAQKIGMAEIVVQSEATPSVLLEHLTKIIHNRSYKEAAVAAKEHLMPDAAQALYEVITYVSQKTSPQKR